MRRLAPEEAALWKRVIASVTPLEKGTAASKPTIKVESKPLPFRGGVGGGGSLTETRARADKPHPNPSPEGEGLKKKKKEASNTLDASWDRRLSRGLVAPESSIDLHGHSLASAYDRLDHGLADAVARGDRVLLLVTGKPPRAESERPHARGAIRAAVGDWLASSRHADRIAAVRNAHPRHGGTGALYIILRRPGALPRRKS